MKEAMNMNTAKTRTLGRSNIVVSALGVGCWAIGGKMYYEGMVDWWGDVDDAESVRGIQRAMDLGVNLFDTSDVYGIGHSEELLAQGLRGRRHQVVIATKFGFTYDEATRHITGTNVSPAYIRQACEASLRRLGTDYIDLYQLHCGATAEEIPVVLDTLDQLCAEGKIRGYGWSTGDANAARHFAQRSNCIVLQHGMNLFDPAEDMVALSKEFNLVSIANAPLASGLLSGKYNASSQLPADDFRSADFPWAIFFKNGRPNPEFLQKLEAVREILTSGGRTVAQGALAWIWARAEHVIPIPGFKTVKQVEENCKALEFGPLTPQQMSEIEKILQREA
jgi:aryl-alcohol dehydrogenase-like predicted oxidoreductase